MHNVRTQARVGGQAAAPPRAAPQHPAGQKGRGADHAADDQVRPHSPAACGAPPQEQPPSTSGRRDGPAHLASNPARGLHRFIEASGGLDDYLLNTPDSQLFSDVASQLKVQLLQVRRAAAGCSTWTCAGCGGPAAHTNRGPAPGGALTFSSPWRARRFCRRSSCGRSRSCGSWSSGSSSSGASSSQRGLQASFLQQRTPPQGRGPRRRRRVLASLRGGSLRAARGRAGEGARTPRRWRPSSA